MDDSKLLELASLASGDVYSKEHNPLERDDLALRLAVKLGIGVLFDLQDEKVTAYEQAPHDGYHVEFADEQDPYAAIRRAIVRAAAEIGKKMP